MSFKREAALAARAASFLFHRPLFGFRPLLYNRRILNNRLSLITHLALDLDGTIYTGGSLMPDALSFLALLDELGIGKSFLTNNSSKSSHDYLKSLSSMGIASTAEQLYTSTQATIEYIRTELPQVKRLFLLGTPSMAEEVASCGFTLTADDPEDEPDAVVVGFDTSLTYSRLCCAAYWVKNGKPFIATNPDRVCPTDQPTLLVDCGSICAAVEKATSRTPDKVAGKPEPYLIQAIMRRQNLRPENIAMVGDRLYTDMVMASGAGVLGVLVLTGETKRDDLRNAPSPPDLMVNNLAELGELLSLSRNRN